MSLAKQICVALLALSLGLIATALPAMAQESPRKIVSLSDGWRFRYGDAPEAITAAGFDDSGWEKISVPHTWNRIGEYALERSAATNNKQGVGWYRLTYNAPPSAKGKRQYLDFAAVAIIADVWVNGVHVGQHKGAFSRFRFDVTSAWKPGAANVIVVKADNSKPAPGSSTENVIPLAGDFFIHGGIYRGVSLIEANDVGIDLLDFGGPGVYARGAFEDVLGDLQRFRTVDGMRARIPVVVRLRNAGKATRRLDVTATVRDADGTVVASDSMPCAIKSGSTAEASLQPVIANLHLWNGTSDPYRYSMTVSVAEKGTVVDAMTQPLGIRTFHFDPQTGFALNGEPLKLHGVSRHQDRMGQGYALTRADHKQDMDLIAEMGANAVRMAHYQHDDAWADEADAHGMIVWAEVPFVTTPSFSGGEGSPELFANAEQQTRELIRQMYNHPSIMMWSVGNEVDAATMFGASKEPVKPKRLLERLAAIAKEEDPSRPTVFADCCEDIRGSFMSGETKIESDKVLAGTTDLIGYNRYYGWYYPQPLKAAAQLAGQMDKFHAKHPTIPISISEYGAGGAISQHSDNVLTGFVNAIGRPQTEEYESWVHEQSWPVIRDRPFIFGSYAWNMFDFASDLRNEGDSVDINTKGLVTFDRKTKKDAFYYYQAQWSRGDMIWLTGKRYQDRAYPVMDVKAYTNLPKALLEVNKGKPLVETDCPGGVCIWKNVALKSGRNEITAYAPSVDGVMPVQVDDTAIFIGPNPAKDGIHLDAGDISGRVLPVAPAQAGAARESGAPVATAPASAGATRRFGSDNFVTGGTPAVLNMGGFGGRTSGPKKTVTAPDPSLYDYWREGDAFGYAIPVPDGKWTVTIHSFEPRASESGTMTVAANGKVAIPAFSVKDAAGGALKGLTKSFSVTVKGGILKLDFTGVGGKAVVAAIEVTR